MEAMGPLLAFGDAAQEAAFVARFHRGQLARDATTTLRNGVALTLLVSPVLARSAATAALSLAEVAMLACLTWCASRSPALYLRYRSLLVGGIFVMHTYVPWIALISCSLPIPLKRTALAQDVVVGPPPATADFIVPPGAVPLWADDFAGSELDRKVWAVQTGLPDGAKDAGQMQEYTASSRNVRVEGGKLLLTARNDNGYTSGQVRSQAGYWPGMPLPGGGTTRSVHVEARMTAPPGGAGLWAAFWMQPVEEKYGGWPASGEIDIVGCIDNMVDATSGLHFGAQYPGNTIDDVRVQQPGQIPYSDSPHTFELVWERDAITISVDGVPSRRFESRQLNPTGWFTAAAGTSPQAPFDQPFRIVLNLAIGGTWPGPPDASTPFPATLAVDYVHVWAVPDS
ncbi:(1-3)-beta-glucanase [Micractinium conductrix]|uniref:(1-3)-beta-glucanase n=1 Tax=Micractinium conductrix TaxID=554055 RepID=A0A2P6VSC9_9CHLO|nr:(1-3)-beta-glucanase [Micractinium conductrix]|eukprot:PSC76960.1 (1-3)-beta-glucanase [Micractinium conductrix]